MHITVDGKPIDDPGRSSSDIQRCTDVALDNASIRFRFDNLESRPRLAVAAHPVSIPVRELADGLAASVVRFKMYNNYSSYISRAEIRVFDAQQSVQALPLSIIPIDDADLAEWQPPAEILVDQSRDLMYLLRAYDSKGNFDETDARPLWLYREKSAVDIANSDSASANELLAAYGENDMALHQIPVGNGTVKVKGAGIPADHRVWVAGHLVPLDPEGNFVAEEILPTGTHTVEVAVLDGAGSGSLYLRDLEFKRKDLFYFGVADLTLSKSRASGPVKQLQGLNAPSIVRFDDGGAAGILCERSCQQSLEINRERGYRRRCGERLVQ
jgi:hypothetical protein